MDTTSTAVESVGGALARLIREQGRLKYWLAEQMGCTPERLSRILTGEREMTLGEASKAASALGVPISTFIAEAE